jgi:hypothetical protein
MISLLKFLLLNMRWPPSRKCKNAISLKTYYPTPSVFSTRNHLFDRRVLEVFIELCMDFVFSQGCFGRLIHLGDVLCDEVSWQVATKSSHSAPFERTRKEGGWLGTGMVTATRLRLDAASLPNFGGVSLFQET